MLSKVLSKNTCADCKFCCSFRRCSLWETPLFSKETMDKLEKPFDCKIWPLRIMKKDYKVVISFTPTCPALGKLPSEDMKKLVNDGLGQTIYEYAKEHPYIIKEYKEGFPILMER